MTHSLDIPTIFNISVIEHSYSPTFLIISVIVDSNSNCCLHFPLLLSHVFGNTRKNVITQFFEYMNRSKRSIYTRTEVYLGSCQTSMMKFFIEIVNF